MSETCITGRHGYEHLGYTCDEVDEQLRVMREVALGRTSIESETGPMSVWNSNGDPVLDAVVPDGITTTGEGRYASGFIGTAHDDDAEDD